MGNLAEDVELTEVGPGTFERTLSADWEIWGPNGGYVAAVALHAAHRHCGRARPANITVHFLGVANFDEPVTVTVETLRSARQVSSLLVRIDQSGRPILSAMVWAVDADLGGLAHDAAVMPNGPTWSECPTIEERWAGADEPSRYRFWDNFEQRPLTWIADWENREPQPPLYQNWMRYVSGDAPSDPWDQAARLLVLVDLGGWPAVGRAHLDNSWIAPSIDVSCEFHRLPSADEGEPRNSDEWLLLHAQSPHAGDGLIATHQQVWNDRGELLASGISHLLCRRVG
ncbi:MAG: thioesterase family protein [Ilumatobacteraceae bacterium]